MYKVIPADEAIQASIVPEIASGGDPIPPGYSVRIVPLEFISPIQMEKLLAPFTPPKSIVRTDVDRNLIIVAGTQAELVSLIETVRIFDVDWLAGMSVGIHPLTHVGADTMAQELDAIFGDEASGPLDGLVRFVPLKRLNALLTVSARAAYIVKVEEWIARRRTGRAAPRSG